MICEMRKIYAKNENGENSRFCSEFMGSIPNGIVNKKICGAGLTSVAIESNEPTILVFPTIQLILNKMAQYPNERYAGHLFPFYSGNNNVSALLLYAEQTRCPKILVTYDSFHKVAKALGTGFKIVVDEFSEFLDAYTYRKEGILSCVETLKHYKNVSFISATPINEKYLPDFMKDLDNYEIEWGNLEPVRVIAEKTNKPYLKAASIIQEYLEKGKYTVKVDGIKQDSTAAYFFLNSVTDISKILNHVDLNPDLVKVICGDRRENELILGKYNNSCLLSEADQLKNEKPFNFITKTGFNGVDFYSKTGLIFVVSSVTNQTTLVSIDTDIPQIAGRIRTTTNPFRNCLFHYYNTYKGFMKPADFEKMTKNKLQNSENYATVYKNMPTEARSCFRELTKLKEEKVYLKYNPETDEFVYDDMMYKTELRHYDKTKETYSTGIHLVNAYANTNIQVKHLADDATKEKLKKMEKAVSFAKCCEWYAAQPPDMYAIMPMDRDEIAARYPIIKQVFDYYGEEEAKKIPYTPAEFKKAARAYLEKNVKTNLDKFEANVRTEIYKEFRLNTPYTGRQVKRLLSRIYAKLGSGRKAKGSDLFIFLGKNNVEYKSFRQLGNSKAYQIINIQKVKRKYA